MRHTIKKLFWVWDFDKEEKWLNEMAAKGLALVSVGFCRYEFEDTTPGEYTVRMEYLENGEKHPETHKYISFMEETGAEQVGYFNRWVFFRKKTEDGAFEIFSDHISRIKHLKRIISWIMLLAVTNLLVGSSNVFLFFTNLEDGIWLNALGFINILLAVWAFWGNFRLVNKKKRLEKEKQIYE